MYDGGETAWRPPGAWEKVGKNPKLFYRPPNQSARQPIYPSAVKPSSSRPPHQPLPASQPCQPPYQKPCQLPYQKPCQPQYHQACPSQYQQPCTHTPEPECHSTSVSIQTTCQKCVSQQMPRLLEAQSLYSRQWGEDLYSMTEVVLGEVSVTDTNCPVCLRDRSLTRHRGTREQLLQLHAPDASPASPLHPGAAAAPEAVRAAAADPISRILVSSNSSLAAIYIDVARAAGSAASAGRGTRFSAASTIATSSRSTGEDSHHDSAHQGGFRSEQLGNTLFRTMSTTSASSTRSELTGIRDGDAAESLPPTQAPPPPPPPPLPPRSQNATLQSMDVSSDSRMAAERGGFAATPLSTGASAAEGTPDPWTSGSGSLVTPTTATLGQVEGRSSASGSVGQQPPGQPYKTTIQLLKFSDREAALNGGVPPPKRIQPPLFLSRHKPELVVSGKNSRPHAIRHQPERGNFSNSLEPVTKSALLQGDRDDQKKQMVASAIHLTRLIESSWGQF